MVIPSSRFSNTAETGIRVPRNTHAPLIFPGTLSTAEHFDQSRADITFIPAASFCSHASKLRPSAAALALRALACVSERWIVVILWQLLRSSTKARVAVVGLVFGRHGT